MNLGENIYRLRTEKNMSQGDLADALNVSRQSVSKWENNSATPELEKLIKMSDLFGITIDELVGKASTKVPPSAAPHSPPAAAPQIRPVATRKIAGGLLLLCALLCILVPASLGAFNTGFILCIPFALCGTICLCAKEHIVFSCLLALYLLLWLPMGIFAPLYINYNAAKVSQLLHLFWGAWLFAGGLLFKKHGRFWNRKRTAVSFFIVVGISALLTSLFFLFPELLPTPGLLHS